MKERFAKLIDVKSIMTLALTIVFCVLALAGVLTGEQFLTIFTVIVGFYFGTQAQKRAETDAAGQHNASAESTPEEVNYLAESMDEATVQETHPPDPEKNETDIVVSGFAG